MLYEALTGDPPFTGDNATEVMRRCVQARWRRCRRVSNVPPELEQTIHRMLQPDPNARPVSARVLAGDFRVLAQRLGDFGAETASAKPPPRRHSISESEERTICAILISLVTAGGRWAAADGETASASASCGLPLASHEQGG